MNKSIKKVLSALLAIVMIMTMMPMAFAAEAETNYAQNDEPLVVVRGIDFAGLIDGEGNKAITVDVMDIVDIIPTIGLQYVTKNELAVVNTITDLGRDIFKKVARDAEGNPNDPSVHIPKFPKSAANYDLSDDKAWADTAVGLYRSLSKKYDPNRVYLYTFDWRQSPDVLADDLKAYFDNVMAETGAKKLDVAACSMGGMITTSYIYKYGTEIFDNLIFLSGAHNGGDLVGSAFMGDLTIDGKALGDFLVAKTNGFVSFLIKIINALGITNKLAKFVNGAIVKYKDQIYGDFLRECFATAYGLWALIPDEYFDTCVSFFFDGTGDKYKTAQAEIAKIRDFVFATEETMAKLEADTDVKFAYVSHYNSKQLPIYSKSYMHGDGVLETLRTSGGATVANYGAKLEGVKAGDKYISPDCVVDASTCLFRDQTWIVKNAKHVGCKDNSDHTEFAMWLLTSETQPTITSNAKYPQFLNCDANENFIGF